MSESVYRHLSLRELNRAYRKALRRYRKMRNDAFYTLANYYLEEAESLAIEIDGRHK